MFRLTPRYVYKTVNLMFITHTSPVPIPNSPVNFYCDVDGVLNVPRKSYRSGVRTQIIFMKLPTLGKYFTKVPYRITWQSEVTDVLAGLPVHFVWLTAWNQQATKIWEPLTGIQSREVLHYNFRLREMKTHVSKYSLLQAHQRDNPSPFVWVDDIATKQYDEADWEGHNSHLVIRPDPKFGLTVDHIAQVQDFIRCLP